MASRYSRQRTSDGRQGVLDAVSQFGVELGPRMRGDGRSEDRLRLPIGNLIRRLGKSVGINLIVHDEVTLVELNSRPDMAIDAPSGRVGYIELKAPGKGTPETWRPNKHDRQQWEKLSVLPNLIYTDGSSWALYRKGELVGRVGALVGDLARVGERLSFDEEFERLIRDFLLWRPERPRTLRAVVAEVAPLCRLLRDQVLETLERESNKPEQPFTRLAHEWKSILFPAPSTEPVAETFPDSYAQAVTFGLLLARVDGVLFEGRSPAGIAEQLSKQHSLLGEALLILSNARIVRHLNVVDTLVRVIGNIDWTIVHLGDSDTYAKLYETFLGDYDPELRKFSGTYYTPAPVARAMVSFVNEIIEESLDKPRGFASSDVYALDPAMGAGTFLAEILDNVATNLQQERRTSAYASSHLRELFASRLIGFELQAAPFAVAELRLHAAMRNRYQIELPEEEPRFLTNTLDDPDVLSFEWGYLYDVLKESQERASRVKRDVPVMVVIGNPPWRERASGLAPWIERSREIGRPVDLSARPSLDEFKLAEHGRLTFNLKNMWTYFWRWSAWKAFEANEPAGVVALITPSTYLVSRAYSGMRRYLRETADYGWIIDLSPEDHRAAVSTRIFPETQHPICIGVFVRVGQPRPDRQASVRYLAISGSRDQKFQGLAKLSLKDSKWKVCPTEWTAPFRPVQTDWLTYPALGDLFPWQQTGVNSNRNWVWAPDKDVLRIRWSHLIYAAAEEKAPLFKATEDRKIDQGYESVPGVPGSSTPIGDELASTPSIVRVAYRSFDRQYLILDRRLIDRPRPELWQTYGPRQVYICEQHTQALKNGPGLTFSALVPNVHCFDGRGGRVLPLFRDDKGRSPNLLPGLLEWLSAQLGRSIEPEDVLAYVAAVVSHPGYTARFNEQLKSPGVRIPITKNSGLWTKAVEIGKRIIWLHTYGERMIDTGCGRPHALGRNRRARYVTSVPSGSGEIPETVRYETESGTLIIGEDTLFSNAGRVQPLSQRAASFEVNGVAVLRKWFSFRNSNARHKRRTSHLDDTNPEIWTAEFDDELLDLIEVLEGCVDLESSQHDLLEQICRNELLTLGDMVSSGIYPAPRDFSRPPRVRYPSLFDG